MLAHPTTIAPLPARLQRERELEAQRQEGYNRMLEEAGAGEGEWTDAGAAHHRHDPQAARRHEAPATPQPRRGGGNASKVIAIPRSVLGSALAMPVPKRASQVSAGASWAEQAAAAAAASSTSWAEQAAAAPTARSASSATTAAAAAAAGGAAEQGGWSFEEWQEPASRQEAAELDSLLAVSASCL